VYLYLDLKPVLDLPDLLLVHLDLLLSLLALTVQLVAQYADHGEILLVILVLDLSHLEIAMVWVEEQIFSLNCLKIHEFAISTFASDNFLICERRKRVIFIFVVFGRIFGFRGSE